MYLTRLLSIRRIRNKRGIATLGTVLALAVLSLLACGERSPEPYFSQLRSRDAQERTVAANKLLRYGAEVVPRLIKESQSGYIRVRFEVVKLLGRIGDRRAVPGLEIRLDDTSSNVAQAAAWALGRIADPAALPALLAYSRDLSKGVRKEVVGSLGFCSVGADSAIAAGGLDAALLDSVYSEVVYALRDPVPDVRIAALLAVRQFGYRGVGEQVIRLSRDPEAEVRHVAVQALGQIAAVQAPGSEAVGERQRGNIVEALIVALDEPYQTIRTKAIRALGDSGDPRAVPHLDRLQTQGGEEDRREAYQALEKIKTL
jgi:HEAT repeat protein